MKIGPLDTKPVHALPNERKNLPAPAPGPTPKPGQAGGAEPSTKVALSPAASRLAAAAPEPAFESAKVDRIAQAIRGGKFEINAGAIADKLIAHAQELLTRKPS